MVDPDCSFCPSCLTPRSDLRKRFRVYENGDGEQVTAGSYLGCECGAYTFSPANGKYNLRTEVAEEAGIVRKVGLKPLVKVRRRGQLVWEFEQ